ncbi:hypothetical protein AU693_004574 [Salmonella enterica subsp. diarizonae]|nr:hypothetical protein [Salmonella enterica subsp. diarizonae]
MNKKGTEMKKIKNNKIISLSAGIVCTLILLALLPVSAFALGPGCQPGSEYTTDGGLQQLNLNLTPDKINLNKDTPVNSVIYETTLPTIQFTCYTDSTKFGPVIEKGARFTTVLNPALREAGLKLQLEINGEKWMPDEGAEYLAFPDYTEKGSRTETATGKLRLLLARPIDKPVKISVPATSDILEIKYGPGRKSNGYIALGTTNSTWIHYIPQCIGKTSVPAEVDLGRVITGGKGSLPLPRTFHIKPSFNSECAGFDTVNNWGGFALNLSIQFEVTNSVDLTSGGKGIKLKNKDSSQDNGLMLVIKKDGAVPVTFNRWENISPAITASNSPLDCPYTASLEPVIPGTTSSAKTGSFSQQITVKVRYE